MDVAKLREDLLLKLERERSDDVADLRTKQKQVGNKAAVCIPISLDLTILCIAPVRWFNTRV